MQSLEETFRCRPRSYESEERGSEKSVPSIITWRIAYGRTCSCACWHTTWSGTCGERWRPYCLTTTIRRLPKRLVRALSVRQRDHPKPSKDALKRTEDGMPRSEE